MKELVEVDVHEVVIAEKNIEQSAYHAK